MKIKVMLLTFMIALLSVCPAEAKEPYEGKAYNTYNEKIPSPNIFLPQKVITGIDLGIGQLNKPADVFVDSNNDIYILDTGNNRIVILDQNFKLKRTLDKFYLNGQESPLKDAAGIFAVPDDNKIYIADRGNERVAVSDYNGNIIREERKPKTEYLSDDIVFAPRKIVVNSIGTMFVLSDNINQGMVSIDSEGVFQGFFGAEKIQLTAQQKADLMWRKFLTKEQQSYTSTFQPTEYTNLFLDSEDFIYTVTSLETYTKAQLKRLNPNGKNILPETVSYGNRSAEMYNNVMTVSALIDVTVDKDGFIYALDKNFGRIYMYDEQAWDLGMFGKKDNIWGTFSEPVAIENVNGKIIVLDNAKANLTVFEPTEYGRYIMDAINYHYKGRYEQAKEPWQMVKNLNNNYEWAYAGIGRAEHMVGEYKEAMENFKKANNKSLYSISKKKYRNYVLKKNFTLYTCTLLFLLIGGYILIRKRKDIAKFINNKKEGRSV
ncbi:MAG: NHL repeat-containing protein [Clostridia bacterium]|nr:NHL repeat-containing protein [Clostridia bacterium]